MLLMSMPQLVVGETKASLSSELSTGECQLFQDENFLTHFMEIKCSKPSEEVHLWNLVTLHNVLTSTGPQSAWKNKFRRGAALAFPHYTLLKEVKEYIAWQ